MKNIKTFILLLAMTFVTGMNVIAASHSEKEQQDRNIKNFTGIYVSTGIELHLTAGNQESVRIEASDEVIDDVATELKGNTLHIYMKRSNWLGIFNWKKTGPIRAYVTVETLNELKATSGSSIRAENTLEGSMLSLGVSSGSDVILDVVYRDLKIDISSGSNVRLSGRCKNLETDASSGSIIDAKKLEAVNCRAAVSSGANINLWVTGELRANASSGGNIRYAGNPGTKDINNSSGGSVSSL